MKKLKLIDNLQAFNIDFKITVRHALFFSYGMYLTYQVYSKTRNYESQIREDIIDSKLQIHQKYQVLYNKTYEGLIDCTIDQGDWIFSRDLPKVNENYQMKQIVNQQYQRVMPLYFISGLGFPMLSIIFAYLQEKDQRYIYALAALSFCSASSLQAGLRIDINFEIPLLENQYFFAQATSSQNKDTTSQIEPQFKLLANLKGNALNSQAEKFDFITIEDESDMQCYQKNVILLKDVYSCTHYCTFSQLNSQLGQQSVSQVFENSSYYIIDNTQLPCVNGTFFKRITPWITIQTLFIFKDASYLMGTIIIIMFITVITIQIISLVVFYYKLRKYKKKIKRYFEKRQSSRNFIHNGEYLQLDEEGQNSMNTAQ